MIKASSVIVVIFFSLVSHAQLPKGWFLAGSDKQNYNAKADSSVKHSGYASGQLWLKSDSRGFGTLMQMTQANNYKGQRVRLSVYLKTAGADKASLFFRVDGLDNQLGFASLNESPIVGDSDWQLYSLTLDVPADAVNIAYGSILIGDGTLWSDDFKLEVVNNDVASDDTLTDEMRQRKVKFAIVTYPLAPINLLFEDN